MTTIDDEALASIPADSTPEMLYTWGLSGEPVDWAYTHWQPVIAMLRAANRGETDAAGVQAVLDATFGPDKYNAADIMLAHGPTGTFTVGPGDTDTSINFALDADADLNLPDANVTWSFGDGTTGAGNTVTHDYGKAGLFTARLEVVVAGSIFGSDQDVAVAGGEPGPPAPVLTSINPTSRVVAPTDDETLHCYGANFTAESVIVFAGNEERTDLVSAGEVTTIITGTLFTGPDTVDVLVRTPGSDPTDSDVLTFEFTELQITAPTDEATVDPVHDVIGDGAGSGATVGLHSVPGPDTAVATITADPDGTFGFMGDTPVAVGDMEWFVKVGDVESPHVSIHVVDEVSEPQVVVEGYDPSRFTVDEVATYAEAHPDQLDAIIAAEQAGKNRSTLMDRLMVLKDGE